jgi:hypothetical protein
MTHLDLLGHILRYFMAIMEVVMKTLLQCSANIDVKCNINVTVNE